MSTCLPKIYHQHHPNVGQITTSPMGLIMGNFETIHPPVANLFSAHPSCGGLVVKGKETTPTNGLNLFNLGISE